MTTSQTSSLSKPTGANRIEPWELAYFQARNRSRAHELVLKEFQESGITQADLARRLGKRPEVVSRLLGAPGNWGLDTLSDLIFAIRGGEIQWAINYPLDDDKRNYRRPEWLEPESHHTDALVVDNSVSAIAAAPRALSSNFTVTMTVTA